MAGFFFKKVFSFRKNFSPQKIFSSRKVYSRGFSLIELCITLLVMGTIFMMMTSAMRSYHTFHSIQKTRHHQQLIFQALTHHFLLHGCLPTPEYPDALAPAHEEVLVGIVPFRQLGLPENTAKDGFHHWMTYAVDRNMTAKVKGSRYIVCDYVFSSKSSLHLKDKGEKMMQHAAGDGVACLLVSHGKTGWGSFHNGKNRYMPQKNISWSQSKKRNANDKNFFSITPAPGEVGCFDDDVIWLTKGQLLMGAGILCADYLVPTEKTDPSVFMHRGDNKR